MAAAADKEFIKRAARLLTARAQRLNVSLRV
jgi:hypothetical protein